VHVVQTDNGAEFQSQFHCISKNGTSVTFISARGVRTSAGENES
jgi:hypothetical protein